MSTPTLLDHDDIVASHLIALSDLVEELLAYNRQAVHPGRGKADAALIRKACQLVGLNEDAFLPKFVRQDKAGWGLA